MKFRIIINDGEEKAPEWKEKLKPFKIKKQYAGYYIELSSWGGFVALQRLVGCTAKVYSTDLLNEMNLYHAYPLIKFEDDLLNGLPTPNEYYDNGDQDPFIVI